MRHLFWQGALPEPELQYEVRNGYGQLLGVTDFAWPEWRHVAEFDGARKYRRDLRPGESPEDAVVREKWRENLIRAEDLGMSRVTWPQLAPGRRIATVNAVRKGMEQSRRLYTRNRVVIL